MNNSKSDKRKIKIAIDAMGGDFAPDNEIRGAINLFENHLPKGINLEIVFIGDEEKIKASLSRHDCSNMNYSIVNAEDIITMHDEPTAALKKKNSSLYKGIELHKNGDVDAFMSAGNTGAVLSTSTILLGRINGVSRPTIGSFFPTKKSTPAFVMDVGANITCKAKFLYEFAVMGSIHVSHILNIKNPSVGLLNIGEESSKGTEVIQETYKLLKESQLNFIGNIEGRDILNGTADIVVCDGFTGNIVLKFAESFVGFFKSKVKAFAEHNFLNLGLVALIKPVLKKIMRGFDYQEYGGVPLLGVNGVIIIGHGKSTPKAIQFMLIKALEMITEEVNKEIEKALNPEIIKESKN